MIKKFICALMIGITVALCLTGCDSAEKSDDKIQISMYLWDKTMCRELTPWLESQFPDIEFTFVVGFNTMDYYTDLNMRGNLPDIITCRRFSLNDAAHLSEQLMDLSQTEVVGSFYDSYIENNRETDGAIRWLPMCAEVDGYVANLSLFEEYNIPVPTNYAEFAEACRSFEALGISGYLNDYNEDYSCLEALQGCAISELMTIEGTMWRTEYECESEDDLVGLDDKVWPVVFEKFERYLQDTFVEPADAYMILRNVKSEFLNGKAAIMRGTSSDCAYLKQEYGIKTIMLPYFGETEDDNWLLTYPTCQVAVNSAIEQDRQKCDAVIKVLETMFSEEGQRKVATSNAVLSYNKNVNIELNDAFSHVEDCVNRNHLYMRIASTEMFSISKQVVQKMIRREYGAQEAYEEFNSCLVESCNTVESEVVTTQNTGYAYEFGENGSPAASAVVNTISKQLRCDIAVGYSSLVTAPVVEGEYTARQLYWLVANRLIIMKGQLTGGEIIQLMEWLINVKEDGANPIRHKNLLPVTYGIEYRVRDNGDGTYTLDEVKLNGEEINENEVYNVMTLGDNNFIEDPVYCGCPMPEELKEKLELVNANSYSVLTIALDGGKQMEEPIKYVTVIH